MTSPFTQFTTRLREFIRRHSREPGFGVLPFDGRSSCNASDPGRCEAGDDFGLLAWHLFALQFASNSSYRQFCLSRRATPESVEHWTQIPAVPTAAFKEFKFSCLPPELRTTVFHSSGTTTHQPSRHYHSRESLAIYEASLLPWFQTSVLNDCRSLAIGYWLLAILTPGQASAPHSSLVHMFETVRRALGAPTGSFLGRTTEDQSWTLDFDRTVQLLGEAANDCRPVLLLGTAFSFVHLLDYLRAKDLAFTLPPGSRAMETGGYKGRSRELPKTELHRQISDRLGIPASLIACEYGMSELSSQAYDLAGGSAQSILDPRSSILDPPGRRFQFPPWARSVIVSPETGCEVADGEAGLIRVFDLANVFSVMAVQTEDLAIRRGTGFELIGRSVQAEPRGCSLNVDTLCSASSCF